MAEQQMICASASSSNSSSMVSCKRYDVFLSFRGEDTRKNFTSHLYEALTQKKVETYIDYRLKRGGKISTALIKAIKDSHVSIVILSKKYASSKWCLEELRQIMKCRKNQGQIVLPLFYNVDPSHVRKQTGSYKEAFAKHEGQPNYNKWKGALTKVANLAGWDSRDCIESKLVKKIVGHVLEVLPKLTHRYSNQLEGLVGIENNYEQIESLLKIGSGEVRTIGIWGMGGIGKTTLATALYAKLSHEFEGDCFLANVREKSEKHGLEALHNKLFSELLEEKNYCSDASLLSDSDMRRLARKKVLIVLDDVDTINQLEFLIKVRGFLRPGSRIIVTTRNKHIFHQYVEDYYKVKELSFHQSLQLFCLTVSEGKHSKLGYEDLSWSVISYCKGNPLALKVVGANLRGRSKEAWKSELRKFQEVPNREMHDILKLSYDGLDDSQKDIFLDIACFFKGKPRDWVTNLLEDCNLFAVSGIKVLVDKALITISNCNGIEMHDLIQEMGWKIVRQESIKDPGRRSRLWKPEEVQEVLKYNRGTDVIEGIILELDKLTENLSLSSDCLAKMTNVRFLKIHRGSNKGFNVYFPNGVESLSYKLRYLHWEDFCLESLPSNFCAKHLVELNMPNSKLTKLWDGIQDLVNLKRITLWCSRNLIEIPDLSKAEKLESVWLDECESLRELHPSMSSLPNLRVLSITRCRGIESLNVHSKSLQVLFAYGCSSLKEFLVTSEEMTHLSLYATSKCAILSSILRNRKLKSLCLRICNNLDKVSDDSGMGSITAPDHYGCMQLNASELSSLQALFHNIGHFSSLEMLDLTQNNVESLPANIKNLSSLRSLWLSGCRKLVSLPELPPSLTNLHLDGCNKLVSLPELPPSLIVLNSNKCRKLVSLPELPPSLTELHLEVCSKLVSLQELPPSLTELPLNGCSKLVSLPELPPSLTELPLNGCSKLVSLPDLPPSLTRLYLNGCSKLVSLPELPPFLTRLYLNGCSKLVSLPELPSILEEIYLNNCSKLVSLPELPTLLYKGRAQNCTSLDTDSSQRLLLQHMLQSLISYNLWNEQPFDFIFPGDHVTYECGFRTAGTSITIPYLPLPPSSHLHAFIYYVILPKGFCCDINICFKCSIYQDGKEVGCNINRTTSKNLILEHVLTSRKLISEHVLFSHVELYDHSDDLPFKLEFYCQDWVGDKHHLESIKEFGVFPVTHAIVAGKFLTRMMSHTPEELESKFLIIKKKMNGNNFSM